MSSMNNQDETPPTVAQLSYLWEIYEYRHGLCWKAVYKIVAVVLVLAVLPYAKPELTRPLGRWMMIPPVIGTLLAGFGLLVVNNELRLFAMVKVAYHSLQDRFLEAVLTPDVKNKALRRFKPSRARWSPFDIYVHSLIVVLLLLSLGNVLLLKYRGLPAVPPNNAMQPTANQQVPCR